MLPILLRLLKNPFTYLFLLIYVTASLIRNTKNGPEVVESIMTFLLFVCFLCLYMWVISRKGTVVHIRISSPQNEFHWAWLYFSLWFALYIFFGGFLMDRAIIPNICTSWLLFVILPFIFLRHRGYQWEDFGLSTAFLGRNLRVTFLASLPILAILLGMTPGGKSILSTSMLVGPFLKTLFASFSFALLFAGFFEEFFFRAILQTRFSFYLKSEISGILLASLIFGIYHLPFQYHGGGSAQGDIVHSIANVLTEQMISAPFLGILWARTRNLIAPVAIHSLIDAISGFPEIAEMLGY